MRQRGRTLHRALSGNKKTWLLAEKPGFERQNTIPFPDYGILSSATAGGGTGGGLSAGISGVALAGTAFGFSKSFIRSCSFSATSSFGANSRHLSSCFRPSLG